MTQMVNNTLNLGEVTLNGERYIAVLHYYDENGAPLSITPAMGKVTDVYRKALEDLLILAPKGIVKTISEKGFEFEGGGLMSGTAQAQTVWNNFVTALANPDLMPYTPPVIEFRRQKESSEDLESL